MKAMKTLLMREYWENRGGFIIAPLVTGGFYLVSLVFALFFSVKDANGGMSHHLGGIRINSVEISMFDFFASMSKDFASMPLEQREQAWSLAFHGLAEVFIMVLAIVSVFYVLGSLYDDRRDKSILFWKSLPVSDLKTVASKVLSVFLVMPVIYILVMMVTFVLIMVLGSIVALIGGGSLWASIWQPAPFLSVPLTVLYTHIINTFWAAPLLGWFLFVSSWTKRKPLLVAIIPIFVINFLQLYYYSSTSFIMAVWERFSMWFVQVNKSALTESHRISIQNPIDAKTVLLNAHEYSTSLLSQPDFFWGIVLAAAFFAGAVFIRRYRDESF